MKNCAENPMRHFADGGKIDPEELMRQMQAKYGAPAAGPVQPAQQPAQQPSPQAIAQPAPKPESRGIVNIFKDRGKQIDKAVGYAHGGKIKGPGTPTSDSIVAKVRETGEPIKVSNQERILSADQDALLEGMAKKMGFDSLDAMLEHGTGKPVGPMMKAGKKAAATGMPPEDDERRRTAIGQIDGPAYHVPKVFNEQTAPQADGARRGWLEPGPSGGFDPRTHKGVTPILPGVSAGQEKPLGGANPLPAIASILPEESPIRRKVNEFAAPSVAATTPAAPASIGLPAGILSGADTAAANYGDRSATTPRQSAGLSIASVGDGINKITGSGLNSPLYTNVTDPQQAIAGLKNQTIDAPTEGLQRLANANAIRQEMIDGQSGKSGAIGDTGQAAASNALLDKWGREADDRNMQTTLSGMSPRRAAIAGQVYATGRQAETAARGQDIGAGIAAGHDAVTRRGQDIGALTAGNQQANLLAIEQMRIDGNPLDQKIKQTALDKDATVQQMIGRLNDPALTPEQAVGVRSNLLAAQGKNPNEHRYLTLPNRKTYNEAGQITGEEAGGLFDTVTGKPVGMGGVQKAAPSYDDFAKAYRAKRPGATAEQIKTDYQHFYGGK